MYNRRDPYKMAGEPVNVIECALQKLIEVTDESKTLKNVLKEDIRKSVSTLRKAFCELQNEIVEKDRLIREVQAQLQKEEGQARAEMRDNTTQTAEKGTPTPSVSETRKSYASAVSEKDNFKLILKSKLNESAEAMKVIIKAGRLWTES